MRKRTLFILLGGLFLAMLTVGLFSMKLKEAGKGLFLASQKQALPEANPLDPSRARTNEGEEKPVSPSASVPENPVDDSLPHEVNLPVPFTPQAPHEDWALPYQEACEEASILMVARYKNQAQIKSKEDANQEILKLVEFQNNLFGDYKHTTAEQTAELARKFYGFSESYVKYHFTIQDVKEELSRGNPVIIPAAGKILPNPFFRSPGPLYHMLVIRGYTQTHFITNDPGTKRGEEFVYSYEELMSAAHDWNNGDVERGTPAMIVMQ